MLGVGEDEKSGRTASRLFASCQEKLAKDWIVCWRCGTDIDGVQDEEFLQDIVRTPRLFENLSGADHFAALLIFLCAWMILFPPAIVVVILFAISALAGSELQSTTVALEKNAASPTRPSPADASDEACRRAMAAAMFGVGWFMPLTFYSLWLLLEANSLTVGRSGRLWCRVAWTLNFVVVAEIAFVVLVVPLLCLAIDFDLANGVSGVFRAILNAFENSIGLARFPS